MSKKPKLNVRLLRRIQKHILEEPRRFLMRSFAIKAKTPTEWDSQRWADASYSMPPCGTAACIAGWANLLTNPRYYPSNIKRAEKLIGYKGEVVGLYHRLFEIEGWPEPFFIRYEKAKTPKTRAKVAAARIDYLIKTGQ